MKRIPQVPAALRPTFGKVCCKCRVQFLLVEFPPDVTRADGVRFACRSCLQPVRNAAARQKYAAHEQRRVDARANRARYVEQNYEALRAQRRETRRRQSSELADAYVLKQLVRSQSAAICAAVPKELIEVKRQHLLLLRELKDQEKANGKR